MCKGFSSNEHFRHALPVVQESVFIKESNSPGVWARSQRQRWQVMLKAVGARREFQIVYGCPPHQVTIAIIKSNPMHPNSKLCIQYHFKPDFHRTNRVEDKRL